MKKSTIAISMILLWICALLCTLYTIETWETVEHEERYVDKYNEPLFYQNNTPAYKKVVEESDKTDKLMCLSILLFFPTAIVTTIGLLYWNDWK